MKLVEPRAILGEGVSTGPGATSTAIGPRAEEIDVLPRGSLGAGSAKGSHSRIERGPRVEPGAVSSPEAKPFAAVAGNPRQVDGRAAPPVEHRVSSSSRLEPTPIILGSRRVTTRVALIRLASCESAPASQRLGRPSPLRLSRRCERPLGNQ